jgi:hypothetical protein
MPVYAQGENPFLGLDSRGGLTVNDGSPISLFTPGINGKVIRANLLVTFTAFTSGTATYTLTFLESGVSTTMQAVATTVNVPVGVIRLIRPDAASTLTVQLVGSAFVGTVKVTCVLEDLV